MNLNNEFVFVYKKATKAATPSLKTVVSMPLIYLFGSTVIHFVVAFPVGFYASVIGTPEERAITFVLSVAHVAQFFFILIMTIFLVKRYSSYFFSGSWKINLHSRLTIGLKFSMPYIVFFGIYTLIPEARATWLQHYLLVNGLSLENVTLNKIFILISATTLLATFLEELIYRGMIQQFIKRFLTSRKSVLITAGIFTLSHFSYYFISPATFEYVVVWFLLGILAGFAFNKYNSCISSFIPHLVFNLKYIIIVPMMLTF